VTVELFSFLLLMRCFCSLLLQAADRSSAELAAIKVIRVESSKYVLIFV